MPSGAVTARVSGIFPPSPCPLFLGIGTIASDSASYAVDDLLRDAFRAEASTIWRRRSSNARLASLFAASSYKSKSSAAEFNIHSVLKHRSRIPYTAVSEADSRSRSTQMVYNLHHVGWGRKNKSPGLPGGIYPPSPGFTCLQEIRICEPRTGTRHAEAHQLSFACYRPFTYRYR